MNTAEEGWNKEYIQNFYTRPQLVQTAFKNER
jgi:hypothetical protein